MLSHTKQLMKLIRGSWKKRLIRMSSQQPEIVDLTSLDRYVGVMLLVESGYSGVQDKMHAQFI